MHFFYFFWLFIPSTGTKGDVQKAWHRKRERLGPQVPGQPGPLRRGDHEARARRRAVHRRRVPLVEGRHHHRQPQRPRAAVPVVRAQRQGPQGHPRRRPQVPAERAIPRAPPQGRRRQRGAPEPAKASRWRSSGRATRRSCASGSSRARAT